MLRSCGCSRRPAGNATEPRLTSSPASRRLAPRLRPGGTMTAAPSTRTSSCMNTVSAPGGMGAPVKMRIASRAPISRAAARPAVRRSVTASLVSPAPTSAWRTAKPSTAELSNGGRSIGATTPAASTRPPALASATCSVSATGVTRSAISRSTSPIASSGPPKAKQSSVSWAIRRSAHGRSRSRAVRPSRPGYRRPPRRRSATPPARWR